MEIKFVTHDSKCWICRENNSSSSEHKYKRTDLKRKLQSDSDSLLFRNDQTIKVNGPNSPLYKFNRSLCKHCNDTLTQPHDNSYDLFIPYVLNNTEEIANKGELILPININGKEINYKNVLRYFAKHFGCRLHANNMTILSDLNNFILNRYNGLQTLLIRYEIDLDLYYLLEKLSKEEFMYSNLYLGAFYYNHEEKDKSSINYVYTWFTNQWFKIHFLYVDRLYKRLAWFDEYYSKNQIPILIKTNNMKGAWNNLSIDQIIEILTKNKEVPKEEEFDLNAAFQVMTERPF